MATTEFSALQILKKILLADFEISIAAAWHFFPLKYERLFFPVSKFPCASNLHRICTLLTNIKNLYPGEHLLKQDFVLFGFLKL